MHALYKQGVFPGNYAALRETLDLQEFYPKYKQDGSELDSLKGAQAENVEAEKQARTRSLMYTRNVIRGSRVPLVRSYLCKYLLTSSQIRST